MKIRLFLPLLVFVVFLSACAAGQATARPTAAPTQTPLAAPTQTPTAQPDSSQPQGGHIPVDLPPAQRAAIQALLQIPGISASQVKIVSVEAVDWPDGCLGVVRIGVMCARGSVPGFRILLEAGGEQYEYHTNADGSLVLRYDG